MTREEIFQVIKKAAQQSLDIAYQFGETKEKRAGIVNTQIKNAEKTVVKKITADTAISTQDRLDQILYTSYQTYLAQLETRNSVWQYEYMAFSRRIGEMWEPFAKLPFLYSDEVTLESAPLYETVIRRNETEIKNYVSQFEMNEYDRGIIDEKFKSVFNILESENTDLNMDLHFMKGSIHYVVDYKSGFNSNEKGNTNRLLRVAAIYSNWFENYQNVLFVRQPVNNHYLEVLRASKNWQVFIADQAYEEIRRLSGFDLRHWMDVNMNWERDLNEDFVHYLKRKELFNYLNW